MAERFNRTDLQQAMVEAMKRINPRFVDIVHAEMVRCAHVLKAHEWPGVIAPLVVVNRKPQTACIEFAKPRFISVNFLQIQDDESAKLNMRHSMASMAMHLLFEYDKQVFNQWGDVSKKPKPQLNGYRSVRWLEVLNWFE